MKQLEKRREVLNRIAGKHRWYDIRNQDGPVAQVRIYDEIGFWGITASDFVTDLEAIKAPEIVCAINCPGGDVFDGVAIYNALRTHPAKVTTRVDSLAASIASVIVQAGDHRVMLSAAQMMIHQAWGIAFGTAAEMREMAELLDKQTDNIAGIYASRSGKDIDHFRSLMNAGTWLTDEESVAEGLADEVVDPASSGEPSNLVPIGRTLNDELAEAMDVVSSTITSAGRVAALRAEKGKQLSQVNRESLAELERHMEQLRALLTDPAADAPEVVPTDEIEREFARFVSIGVDL